MSRLIRRAGFAVAVFGLMTLSLASVATGIDNNRANAAAAASADSSTPATADRILPRWHGRGVVRVTKVVTGDGAPPDAEFEICLTGPLPDGPERCKTLTGAGVITFHDLEPGTYTLAERDIPAGFAVSYSASEFVVVKDRFTDITVTNHYTPPMPEVGRAEVTKLVTGDDAPVDAEFEICLTGPLPAETTICQTIDGNTTATFGDLEPGTYRLSESDPPAGVEVTVSAAIIEIIADATTTATVTNHYPPPQVESETPPPTSVPPTSTTTPPSSAPPPTSTTTPPSVGPDTQTRLPKTGGSLGVLAAAALATSAGGIALLISRRGARRIPVEHRH